MKFPRVTESNVFIFVAVLYSGILVLACLTLSAWNGFFGVDIQGHHKDHEGLTKRNPFDPEIFQSYGIEPNTDASRKNLLLRAFLIAEIIAFSVRIFVSLVWFLLTVRSMTKDHKKRPEDPRDDYSRRGSMYSVRSSN